MRSIGPPRRGPPWMQRRAETITGCWAVVNEGLCACPLPPLVPGFSRPACGRWQTCGLRRSVAHGAPIMLYRAPAARGRKGGREGESVAKSGKGQSAGTAGPRARPRTRQRNWAAREAPPEGPRCRGKAEEAGGRSPSRGCPADGPDQGSRAANGRAVGQGARRPVPPPLIERGRSRPPPSRPPRNRLPQSGCRQAGRSETEGCGLGERNDGHGSGSTTSTTRRKTATSSATRTPRTRRAVQADGSGDGTGPT